MFENDMCSHLILVHDIEHANSGWIPTKQFMEWLDSVSTSTLSKNVTITNKEED